MDIEDTHRQTGAAWNETAAIYERDEERDIAMLRAGGNSLLEPERENLGDLSPWCSRAIHLQCSGGTDALSLWRLGAAEVVGIDISERMIASARRKSAALGAPAAWYVSDVLQPPAELDGTADLVYTGRGALPWMMDLQAWAAVVHRLLVPGGRLLIFEGHPLDWVWDTEADSYRLDEARGDYFATNVKVDTRWPAPFLNSLPDDAERPRAWERQWTLGDILNSLTAAGLLLDRFREYPLLYWNQFPNLPEDLARRLPHTFALLMRKSA
jgi:SAM-dependent methyltransferase